MAELSAADSVFMERAFEMAEEALRDDEVPVGCVFVHDGKEIGTGRNRTNKTRNPTAHAELVALKEMESRIPNLSQILPEIDLFVTLEPCIMCASGLYELGIRKIVYGAENERFGGMRSVGSAEKYGIETKIEVIGMVEAERSVSLLKSFYDKENPFAPEDKKKIKKEKVKP